MRQPTILSWQMWCDSHSLGPLASKPQFTQAKSGRLPISVAYRPSQEKHLSVHRCLLSRLSFVYLCSNELLQLTCHLIVFLLLYVSVALLPLTLSHIYQTINVTNCPPFIIYSLPQASRVYLFLTLQASRDLSSFKSILRFASWSHT